MRSAERRSDGGTSAKQARRSSDRVRRDRFSPPASRHMTSATSQAEWKAPPTGDRSRSGHHDAKGNNRSLLVLTGCNVDILALVALVSIVCIQ